MNNSHLKNIWNGPKPGVDPRPLIYLSGILGGGNTEEALRANPEVVKYQCVSYFYLASSPASEKETKYRNWFSLFQKFGTRAFLDSGAFSYQIQGIKKNQPLDQKRAAVIIDQYVDWVFACPFIFDFIVTFDYKRDSRVTDWATERIEKRGLHPVPAFHSGTSLDELRKLIDRGYDLIGVGGLIPYRASKIDPFLDHVFNLAAKYNVRLHGFGLGGPLIFKYPWFSVDTSAWSYVAKVGKVFRKSTDPRKFAEVVTISPRSAVSVLAEDADTGQRFVENWKYYNTIMETRCTPGRNSVTTRKTLF